VGEGKDEQGASQNSSGSSINFLYFNGFDLSTSLSDMGMLLMIDGQPQVRLAMSFTTAKTLAVNLSQAVEAFENSTNHQVMTMDDVRENFERTLSEKS
jgi:hypothetical protein